MKIFLMLMVFLFTSFVHAYVVPTYRDLKPASQAMLELQAFGTPAAASNDSSKVAYAGTVTTSADVTLTSFTAQPDVPRNIVIHPSGTTTDIEACVIVVNGTNYFGRSITENFTFTANQSSDVTGAKAFKTLTSVVFPVDCESGSFGALWSIGWGEKIGLKRCMANAGDWSWSTVGGVYETTRATIVADADEVEKNTADFNGTMTGSAAFRGFFVQNFACLP